MTDLYDATDPEPWWSEEPPRDPLFALVVGGGLLCVAAAVVFGVAEAAGLVR